MAEKKDTAKPTAAPPQEGAEGEKAKGPKKINRMTLAEIDAKLNEVRVSQGGLKSRYAKQLLGRKKALGA
jgi:hypothetical protein